MKIRHIAAALLATVAVAAIAGAPVSSVAAEAARPAQRGLLTDLVTLLLSNSLQRAVKVDGIREHLDAFQAIASDNDDTRASGTPGFADSVRYVARKLRRAGYDVTVQPFEFPFFQELSPAEFDQVSPAPEAYVLDTDFTTMEFSNGGDVTGLLIPVDVTLPPSPEPSSTSGCEATDYPANVDGNIALIQRGTCTFGEKAAAASAAGAIGVVIFNEGQPGRTDLLTGTLGGPADLPVIGTTFELGNELYAQTQAGPVTVHVAVDAFSEPRTTWNVLADSRRGNAGRVVVVGAHLDSVVDGPGINDNGSGSATILEIAEQMARLHTPIRNRVRFAFWGAEESGLLGAEHYVADLSDAQRSRILLNLNFDMVGSPNFVRFVYDGNGSDTPDPGPDGSGLIENVFLAHFARKNLATAPTAFDGRSDYGPFIAAGIPAGGLFSGAEGLKTEAEARIYGGTAGEAYDPCYHQACDTIENLNNRALDQFSDAGADATLVFARRTQPVVDTAEMAAARLSAAAASQGFLYKGSHLQR